MFSQLGNIFIYLILHSTEVFNVIPADSCSTAVLFALVSSTFPRLITPTRLKMDARSSTSILYSTTSYELQPFK